MKRPAVLVALGTFVLHLYTNRAYGYFRDELYYLACTEHLDFGYVDHPPFSIFILWVVRSVFGDSLTALRLIPSLTGALTIVITGRLAERLGGGRYAQLVAALAVAIGPGHLAMTNFYSMNAIDLLVWASAVYLFTHAIEQSSMRWWVALGLTLGLGLLNKVSVLWLGAGIGAALLLTHRRALLLTPGPWVAAAIAALMFVPHVLWQIAHGWPTLEFVRNATAEKMVSVSPTQFIADQVLMMHPLTVPVTVAGLWWLLAGPERDRWRALAWTFLAPLGILLASGTARAYYLGPAYPPVFAAGGVAIAAWTATGAWRHLRPALPIVMVIGGAITAGVALPVLPVERQIAYSRALGVAPRAEERIGVGELPQHLADMFGWPELVDAVARVYRELPAEERAKAGIYTDNYGRAGAIDFFGPAHGLPKAISGHNSYFLWGPRGVTGEVLIVVGGDPEDHAEAFADLRLAAVVGCRYCMPYESEVAIYVGRGPRRPLPALWPEVKKYI